LEPPIPWQKFPRSAGEVHAAATLTTRPDEVLLFIGAKSPSG
jgi:hypothetical protein